MNKCKECGRVVEMSLTDRFYVELFGTCWECDKKHWQEGTLTLEVFEGRETAANKAAVEHLQACTKTGGDCNGDDSGI